MREHRASLLRSLRELLHIHYDSIVEEPLPDRWVELIHALNERESRENDKDANAGAAPVNKDS